MSVFVRLAYDDGEIFLNPLDNHMVALDAATGRAPWVTTLGDIDLGETITMAPLAAKGRAYAGNSGGEMGVRGWLTAEKLRSKTPYPETLDYASRQTNLS